MVWRKALLVIGTVLALGAVGLACNITISADGDAVYGKEFVITVDVQQIHRNCVTPIEDTQIDLHGLSVVDYTSWQEVEPGLRRLKLTVVPNWVGKVGIDVRRDCVKYGPMEKQFYVDASLGLQTARKLVPNVAQLAADGADMYRALAGDGTLLAKLLIAEGTTNDTDFQLLVGVAPDERVMGVLPLTPLDVPADALTAYLDQFSHLAISTLNDFSPQPVEGHEALSRAILQAIRAAVAAP